MSQAPGEFGQGEGVLKDAATYVSDARISLDKLSSEMDTKIQGLRGKWAGAGGEAFFILQAAWVEKQGVITSALNEFEASLLSTEKDNLNTDDAQSATFNKTASRLGGN